MTLPEPFKIFSPEGDYHVNYDIDLDSLAFPIICKPVSFIREMIRFLNRKRERQNHLVNVLLIEKSQAVDIDTFNVVPLLVNITFEPHNLNLPVSNNGEYKKDGIKQFHDFVDQLLEDGELDYLFHRKDGE